MDETTHAVCVLVHLDAVWELGPKLDMMYVKLFSQYRHIDLHVTAAGQHFWHLCMCPDFCSLGPADQLTNFQ